MSVENYSECYHCTLNHETFATSIVRPETYDIQPQDRETTVEEDIHLVESVQRGLKSRGYRPGPLVMDPACGVNSEHSIAVLQSWMRDAADRMETTAAGL